MMRYLKISIICVILMFLGWVAYIFLDMKLWKYRDISILDTSLKHYLFNDTSLNMIVTHMCKANPRDDTVSCFTYKNEYLISCLKLDKYSNIQCNYITQGKPVRLDYEQSQTYFMYSGGEQCPIYLAVIYKIPTANSLSVVLNDCDTINKKITTREGMLFEVKCSNIGIFSVNQSPDIIFDAPYPDNKTTLLLLKTPRGFFILLGYNIKDSKQNEVDLVSLLNNNSFPMLTQIRP
jgi:hypothetical protein